MIVHHYWVHGPDGTPVLYEAAYQGYARRPGVICHVKIPFSDHPCTCPERDSITLERAASGLTAGPYRSPVSAR